MHDFGPDVVIKDAAFIHPTVLLYGDVTIGQDASLWPHVVMRAESERIVIGRATNMQDFVMVHTAPGVPTTVGEYCSVTHHATVHGCAIGDNCLIGINATLMDGSAIGDNSIVAGHAIIAEGVRYPDNSIVAGVPGKLIRRLNSFVANRMNAVVYLRNALAYAQGHHRCWTGADFEDFLKQESERIELEFKKRFGDDQALWV